MIKKTFGPSDLYKPQKSPFIQKDKKEAEFLVVMRQDEHTNVEQEVEEALNNSFGNSLDLIPDSVTKQSAYISDYGRNNSEKKYKNIMNLSGKHEDPG